MLAGVNVALGVTGSIAAVKVVELAHELRRQGAAVRAVMTESARGILHPWAVEFATDRPVVTELTGAVEHVELCGREGWADVLLVAPATANTVGKVAAAVDDTPVTTCATTALGADVPVVVAPAMHEPMYDHPGVLEAVERVESWGVDFVDPRIEEGKAKLATEAAVVTAVARATTPATLAGRHVVVTSGATSEAVERVESWGVDFVDPRIEEGKAKLATEAAVVTAVARATTPATLAGRHVVVTSGATSEAVDPIRTLTNRSSGKTGRAVARACRVRGADVTLVHGALGAGDVEGWADSVDAEGDPVVHYADAVPVESAADMRAAVAAAVADADALVSAAAVGDYTVDAAAEKIRSGESPTLELEPTPKLIDEVRSSHPDLPIVGFKAETSGDDEGMVEKARELLARTDLAFVVANDAGVMGRDATRAHVVRADSAATFEGTKAELGARVADELADELG